MVSVRNVIVDVIVMKICVLIVQMTFVVIVIVIRKKMGIFKHEDMILDIMTVFLLCTHYSI